LRHDDKASNGSPNGSALRPTLGRARGATPPCALGSSESRQRREVGRARGTAPPCVPGSSKNRQRRAVWSRFLRFLVVLISISRPRQSARSGWGHCLTRYRRARSLASRSCYREDRARVKREPQSDAAQSIVSGVERSSVRGRKPEFEQLALLIETAVVENRSVAPADRGICRWPRDRR
jgi:hypothetical protein